MLEKIQTKLRGVSERVYYGSADNIDNAALWDYIVFFRERTARSMNATSYTDYFTVAVVCENWIPQELIISVIEAMESIAGMRLAKSDIEYNYTRKPSTNAVIEIATMSFGVPRKKG